jgi:site-specific recombinase XerD
MLPTDPYRPTRWRLHAVQMLTGESQLHLRWMAERNMARDTIGTRRTVLTALEIALGGRPAHHATRDDIEAMLRGRDHQPGTRNVWISHLSSFFKWARREQHVAVSPMEWVDRAQEDEHLPRPILEDALTRAIELADAQMALWLVLGAYAGLRCQEIAHLDGRNVSLDVRSIRVERTKRGRSRVIPLHPRIAEHVAPFLRPGRLWSCTPNTVSARGSKFFHRIGEPYTMHQLRHRFATQLYEATGGDLNLVRELLGHASTETTQVYAKVSVTRMQSAVALIA